jgi:hypothetical protein
MEVLASRQLKTPSHSRLVYRNGSHPSCLWKKTGATQIEINAMTKAVF